MDKKVLTVLIDTTVSSTVYIVGWLVKPDLAAHIILLIGAWQPVIIALVIGQAQVDAELIKAGFKKK